MRLAKLGKMSCYSLAVLLSFSFFFLCTNMGLQVGFQIAKRWLPGDIQVSSLRGKIISGIQLQGLTYNSPDLKLSIAQAQLQWNPKAFLHQQWDITDLTANKIKVISEKYKTEDSKANVFEPDQLNFLTKILFQHLKITDLTFIKNKKQYVIQAILITRQKDNQYQLLLRSTQGELTGKYQLELAKDVKWNINLNATNFNINYFVNSSNSHINFNFISQGKWDGKESDFSLQLAQLTGMLNNYPLQGNVALTYIKNKLEIQTANIGLAQANATLQGSIDDNWHVQWSLEIPDLGYLIPGSQGNIKSKGQLTGLRNTPAINADFQAQSISTPTIKLANLVGSLTSDVAVQTNKINLDLENLSIADYLIPQIKAKVNTKQSKRSVVADLAINLNPSNQFNGSISLPSFTRFTDLLQPFNGEIKFNFADLPKLIVIPQINKLTGQINGVISMQGTLQHPDIKIHANAKNAGFRIPKLNSTISALQLQADYQPNHPISIDGMFAVDPGTARINGTIDIEKEGTPTALKINGNNLRISNSNEYQVTLSPDIEFFYENSKMGFKGKLLIPQAKIKPKDYSNVTTLPSEVVFVKNNKPVAEAAPNTNYVIDLQLLLGNDVKLTYKNIKTQLKGELMISQSPESLAKGVGELYTVNGKYTAYGKQLTIKEGRLLYAGNALTNPGLDITAIQKFKISSFAEDQRKITDNNMLDAVYTGSDSLTVGIAVKGTLNAPLVSFYSDPAGLSQSDILSYLVFGYPRDKIKSASSLALLNGLASSMNKGGPSVGGVVKKVQKVFGLSEMDIGTTEVYDPNTKKSTSTTTVNLGKKLGKNLSIHYSIGVFNPVSVFNLKYQINKRLAVQSETSSFDTGADILYEFERD